MGWKVHPRGQYPEDWADLALRVKGAADWSCIRCGHVHDPASHYVLTVHHLDGDKSNSAWWNLLALCQRCHLSIQGRVNPDQQYCLEHTAWFKPYAAGYYARKYLGEFLTKQQVMDRVDELLNLERRA